KAFYLGAYAQALKSDPLPFIGMFLRQILLGVEKTFDMFAIHTPFFPATAELGARWPQFLAGTSEVEAGPLNSAART
ncbi:hypothetical protein ACP3V9_25325, partial [Salmonella enterica]|uniref:hypothetical protein n=1 Tax=Salmonella enterica TaxID=28901 RepID=UPI003CE678F4